MKRIIAIGVLLGTLATAVIGAQGVAHAAWTSDLRSGDTVTLAKDEVHKGSLYVAGETVTIEGTVDGSLYCAGSNVTITGKVNGSIACAGQTVTYQGEASHDIRLVGQEVRLENAVAGADATIFANTARIDSNTRIEGDLNGAAQLLEYDGAVAKNLQYAAAVMALGGLVGGDANVVSDNVTFGEKAKVIGRLNYSASRELSIADEKVGGEISYNQPEESEPAQALGVLFQLTLMTAFTGLVLALIAPRFMERSSQLAGKGLGTTVLIGSAVLFLTPIVILLLFLSVLGAPLAFVAMLLYGAMLLLSGAFFAYYLGALLLRSTQNIIVRMIGGAVVLGALWLIPIVNVVAIIATFLVGTGILVRTVTNGYRTPRYSLADEPPMPPMPGALGGEATTLETPKPIAKKPAKSTKPRSKKSDDSTK